jgi:hypothetical protein
MGSKKIREEQMTERDKLRDAVSLEKIRVLVREISEFNELLARVQKAEARSRAKPACFRRDRRTHQELSSRQ